MVKRLRENLFAQGRDKLCEQLNDMTGARILSVFTAINVPISERIFVFVMDREVPPVVR